MSKHHENCKWKNYTAMEFLPCPFCRIEELEERLAKLGKEYNDYVIQSVKNESHLGEEIQKTAVESAIKCSAVCAEIAENSAVPFEEYEQGLAGAFIAKLIRERFSLEI